MNETTTDEIIFDANNLPANIGGVKWYLKYEADKEIERLKAENQKYREALKTLSLMRSTVPFGNLTISNELSARIEIARKALEDDT